MPADIIPLRREKALLDTSIYISNLNKGFYSEPITHLLHSHVLYLHSVVFEELLTGTRSHNETRELNRLKKHFQGVGRVLTPDHSDWENTGLVVNSLLRQQKLPAHKAVSLTHDVLIAVSARRTGMRVITANKRDFEEIRRLRDFKLTIWSPSRTVLV